MENYYTRKLKRIVTKEQTFTDWIKMTNKILKSDLKTLKQLNDKKHKK